MFDKSNYQKSLCIIYDIYIYIHIYIYIYHKSCRLSQAPVAFAPPSTMESATPSAAICSMWNCGSWRLVAVKKSESFWSMGNPQKWWKSWKIMENHGNNPVNRGILKKKAWSFLPWRIRMLMVDWCQQNWGYLGFLLMVNVDPYMAYDWMGKSWKIRFKIMKHPGFFMANPLKIDVEVPPF